jgi:hypothetical protein
LNSNDQQQNAEEKQRAVAKSGLEEKLLCYQPEDNTQSGKCSGETPEPEEMQRSPKVAGGEKDRQQIKEAFPESAGAKFRFSILPRPVLDDLLGDFESFNSSKDGDIPVKFAVDPHRFNNIPAVDLESAVEVVNFDPREATNHEIEKL